VLSAAFSPDGRRVISAGWDGTARVWEIATGRELRRLEGHSHRVSGAAFSAGSLRFSLDGSRLLSGSGDRTLRPWRLPEPPTGN
jgi:WD40 repeat protein